MTTNRLSRCFLLVLLIFAGFAPLRAQDIDTENGERRFLQRLVWAGGEYALRYEVVVQKEVDGRYIAHLRESTETPFIEVSLPPGKYRFRVSSYNILDKLEEVSQWVNIEVRGVQNEVFGTVPELAANGKDDASGTEDVPESGKKKPIFMFADAAWSPVLPIHGNSFGESFSPAGADVRVGTAFSVPRELRLGAEISALWHINSDNDENALSLGVNLLVMKWLSNQRIALNFRLGFSFILLPDIHEKFMINIGASYLWRFAGNLFLEAGFDYAGLLKEIYFDGCIRPRIGFGMIF